MRFFYDQRQLLLCLLNKFCYGFGHGWIFSENENISRNSLSHPDPFLKKKMVSVIYTNGYTLYSGQNIAVQRLLLSRKLPLAVSNHYPINPISHRLYLIASNIWFYNFKKLNTDLNKQVFMNIYYHKWPTERQGVDEVWWRVSHERPVKALTWSPLIGLSKKRAKRVSRSILGEFWHELELSLYFDFLFFFFL